MNTSIAIIILALVILIIGFPIIKSMHQKKSAEKVAPTAPEPDVVAQPPPRAEDPGVPPVKPLPTKPEMVKDVTVGNITSLSMPVAPTILKYPRCIIDIDQYNFVMYQELQDDPNYQNCWFASNTLHMAGTRFSDLLSDWTIRGNVGCLEDGTFEPNLGFAGHGFEVSGPNSRLGKYSGKPPMTYMWGSYLLGRPWRRRLDQVIVFANELEPSAQDAPVRFGEILPAGTKEWNHICRRARLVTSPENHGQELYDELRSRDIKMVPKKATPFPLPH